jgi:hypothetical protein
MSVPGWVQVPDPADNVMVQVKALSESVRLTVPVGVRVLELAGVTLTV